MDDRELLELAARAAGIDGYYDTDNGVMRVAPTPLALTHCMWTPLEDDGDALRLATKLGLAVDTAVPGVRQFDDEDPGVFACAISGSRAAREGRRTYALHGDDPYAATRRAIVRAAAAIAQEMTDAQG